ncbi:MAG: protein kinase, partial [Bifidobacteriaceae bacterium]|nr:protein kinase [Bifidobacteriaceae bacterium]
MIAETGLTLAQGRYRLVSRIAVGGMGEVWRAHDLAADSPVAIKVLRPEFTGDEASLHRLRTEAHNAAMLNHPNIARVYDYREEGGTGFLVLEFVPGQSLADVLAVQSTLPAHQLIDILHQCAEGLFAAHRAGVVHRDVKPGNILLGPGGRVKLTDFGISICLGQAALTATGKVMGTAQYLAPEQALGKPATPAGDMYALGIIAYECLAGTRPFNTGGDVDIALAQVRQPPPPLPVWVDPPLRDLIYRLLAKDPARRPATCGELAHSLLTLRPAEPTAYPDTMPVDVVIEALAADAAPTVAQSTRRRVGLAGEAGVTSVHTTHLGEPESGPAAGDGPDADKAEADLASGQALAVAPTPGAPDSHVAVAGSADAAQTQPASGPPGLAPLPQTDHADHADVAGQVLPVAFTPDAPGSKATPGTPQAPEGAGGTASGPGGEASPEPFPVRPPPDVSGPPLGT